MLEGLRRPDGGSALIEGLDVQSNRAAVQARVGVQLQSTTLFPELSVFDNLRLLAALYRQPLLDRARADRGRPARPREERPRDALGRTAAARVAGGRDDQRPGGDLPRRADDRARPAGAPLPLGAGADLSAGGKTIVLTTHQMEEAEALCGRVAIIDQGRIVAIDTPAGLIARYGGGYAIAARSTGRSRAASSRRCRVSRASPAPTADGRESTLRTSAIERTMLALLQLAERAGARLTDLRVHRPGLEEVFLTLTGHALRD